MPEKLTAIKLASVAIEKRDEIAQMTKSVYDWCREWFVGKENVLILGPGGTGKTTLAAILCGKHNFLLDAGNLYKESVGVETVKISGSPNVAMVIPPGQEHRRQATWNDLLHEVSGGKYRGIVILYSYGFHSIGLLPINQHRLYRGEKQSFVKDFTAERRADEESILTALMPHILANRRPQWLLNLVTKQDLWWPDQAVVESHYREGTIGAKLRGLQDQMNGLIFRCETILASLTISRFLTSTGEEVMPNAAGYDHSLQVASLLRLFETFNALKTWELK